MDGYAKQQVSELLSRSAYALDHFDLNSLESCFHKEATFTLIVAEGEPAVYTGIDEILSLMRGALDVQTDVRRHVISNLWYASTGEKKATVVSYLSLMATENGDSRLITPGVYTDDVVRDSIDGGWVIKGRHLALDRPF